MEREKLGFSLQGGGQDNGAHLSGVEVAIRLFAPFYVFDIGHLVGGTI